MAKKTGLYKTLDFNRDIAAFLGNARLAPRLWHFIRRQIAQQLLDAREVWIADVGTFFFKFRPGRYGPFGKWTSDRLILKFKPSKVLARKFAESQSRGRGKALLEKLQKVPRIRNSKLEYKRVAVRKPFGSETKWLKAREKSASQSSHLECSGLPSTHPMQSQAEDKNTRILQEKNSSGGNGTSSDQISGSENTSASS